MFVLKKLFKLRESGSGNQLEDTEKPFLEHLEDLRDVIIKVVITLMIATVGCYIFRSTLIDILRAPMEQVWNDLQEEKLPDIISTEVWEKAKKAAHAASGLTPEQQTHLYSQFENEELRYYAQTAAFYRAALLIEDLAKRQSFVENFPSIDQKRKDLLLSLLKTQPSAALDAKGSVVYMQSLKPTETFMLAIKLSIFAGIIISFPFLLYFILQFILPGLKENERKALWPAMIIGFGLFLLGVFFCYLVVLPKALDFFFNYSGGMGVENEWRIGDYITFTTQFTLVFGLSFELPVIVMTLVKIGLLSYQTMSNTRSYAVLTIFVVGAVITPTGDALTLLLLALPMCLLYEICIWLAYFHWKKELEKEAKEEAELKEYSQSLQESDHTAEEGEGFSEDEEETTQYSAPSPIPVPGRISAYDEDEDFEDEGDELDEDEHEDTEEADTEDEYAYHDFGNDYTSDGDIDTSFEASAEEKNVDKDNDDEADDASKNN